MTTRINHGNPIASTLIGSLWRHRAPAPFQLDGRLMADIGLPQSALIALRLR